MIALLAIAAVAASGCQRRAGQPQDQNISIDDAVPDNQMAAGNAEIETLPADESSTTPSNQLQNGFDNSDVNQAAPSNAE